MFAHAQIISKLWSDAPLVRCTIGQMHSITCKQRCKAVSVLEELTTVSGLTVAIQVTVLCLCLHARLCALLPGLMGRLRVDEWFLWESRLCCSAVLAFSYIKVAQPSWPHLIERGRLRDAHQFNKSCIFFQSRRTLRSGPLFFYCYVSFFSLESPWRPFLCSAFGTEVVWWSLWQSETV